MILILGLMLCFTNEQGFVRHFESPSNFAVQPAEAVVVSDAEYNMVMQSAQGFFTGSNGNWRVETGLIVSVPPPPAPTFQEFTLPIVAPAITINPSLDGHGYDLVPDVEAGVVIPVERNSTRKTDAEVRAAAQALMAASKATRTALRALKATPEYTGITNQLSQYDGHYENLTNQLANLGQKYSAVTNQMNGMNYGNATQVSNLFTKVASWQDTQSKVDEQQRRATDDLHDALVKVVTLIKELVKNQ